MSLAEKVLMEKRRRHTITINLTTFTSEWIVFPDTNERIAFISRVVSERVALLALVA